MSVSVIIPAFNVAEVVGRAIESALSQTRPVLEVIVIDDGSSDTTVEVVRRLAAAESRIRLITLATNGGPGRARNAGIAAASGDWIGLLDADDTWVPVRVATLLAAAEDDGADFVADNVVFFDAVAGNASRSAFAAPWEQHPLTARDLILNRAPAGGGRIARGILQPMLRREFLARHRLAYDETLRLGEDFKLQAEVLLAGGKGLLVNAPLYIYNLPVGEISGAASGASRTPAGGFDGLSDAMGDLRQRYSEAIDPPLACAMKREARRYRLRHQNWRADQIRRTQSTAAWAGFVLARPALAAFLLAKAPKRARRWLAARSAR